MIKVTAPQQNFGTGFARGLQAGAAIAPNPYQVQQQFLTNQLMQQRLNMTPIQQQIAQQQAQAAHERTLAGQLEAINQYSQGQPGISAPSNNMPIPSNALTALSQRQQLGMPAGQQPASESGEALSPTISPLQIPDQQPMSMGQPQMSPAQPQIPQHFGIGGVLNNQLAPQLPSSQEMARAAVMHSLGMPYKTPEQRELQNLKIQATERAMVSPSVNLARDANNPNLSDNDKKAAALAFAAKNLTSTNQSILTGLQTFLPNYNKHVVPLLQNVIAELNSQGLMAKGKENSAKIASYLGKNNQLANDLATASTVLDETSQSLRQAGGDRATVAQIQFNANLLKKLLKNGKINEAVSSLNELSKVLYDKGNNIISNQLAPVKNAYPMLPKPSELKTSDKITIPSSIKNGEELKNWLLSQPLSVRQRIKENYGV